VIIGKRDQICAGLGNVIGKTALQRQFLSIGQPFMGSIGFVTGSNDYSLD
jgi:hypothetical protein